MTTAYTSLLGLALPVTGELSGTWGDTVNTSITSLLDTSVAGTTNVSTDADVTLTTTTGAANTARQAILLFSGARTALRTVTAPAQSKIYTVINATTGGFSVKLVGAGPTTGVTILAGESAVCAWNGSDFVKVSNTGGSASFVNLTASGTVTFTGLTASQAVFTNASDELVSNAITGTGNVVMSASPTLTGTISAAAITASGTATLNGAVVIFNSSTNTLSLQKSGGAASILFGSNTAATAQITSVASGGLFFSTGDITQTEKLRITATGDVGIGNSSPSYKLDVTGTLGISGNLTLSGGTANGVAYLNGSKVVTSGSALTFDGTNFGVTGTSSITTSAGQLVRISDSTGSSGYNSISLNGNDTFASGMGLHGASGGDTTLYYTVASGGNHQFRINNAEQMRLTSTGLGIGTSSPSAKLQVNVTSTTDQIALFAGQNANNYISIYDGSGTNATFGSLGGGNAYMFAGTGKYAAFYANASEQMRLTSTGLGIGTSSPSYKLDVRGSSGNIASWSDGTTTGTLYAGGGYVGLTFPAATGGFFVNPSGNFNTISTNGVERMRIDSSGNLGLGVTPSAWGSTYKAVQVGLGGALVARTNAQSQTILGANWYVDSGNKYIGDGAASQYQQDAGVHYWYTAPSGTAGNAITFTQAMTLDASGNLGIGTSSPTSKLSVNGVIQVTSGGNPSSGAGWEIAYGTVNAGRTALQSYNRTGSAYLGADYNSLDHYFYTSGTERLRIASTGAFGLSGANYGTSGQVLTSQGSGSAPIWAAGGGGSSQWTTSGSDIYYNTGNIAVGSTTTNTGRISAIATTQSAVYGTADAGYALFDGATNASGARFNISGGSAASGTYLWGYNSGRTGYTPINYGASEHIWNIAGTERMRIDSNGRVGIGTTSQTANLARLQVTHDANTERYGVYVPGNSYVGSGPSGTQYGGYFTPHTSNAASGVVGVAGVINNTGAASQIYGGYFDGGGTASFAAYGVYGLCRQTDNGGPGQAFGGYFVVTTPNPSAGGGGGMIPVRAESQANKGNFTYAVWASTLAGPSIINGYYYEHAGSLQCRIKSNGGIDNYSGNNTNLSDRREKKDFAPAKSYLETICAIPVQTFKYIDQTDDLPTLGVVAQDVQAVAPELVVESNWARHDEEPRMRLSVYETDLVYALMKSLQELKSQFDEYKASHP